MEILAGTLLTPDTLSPQDVPLELQDPRFLTWRDGLFGLDNQREHVTLRQLALPGDGAHSCWLTGAFKSALDAKPLSAAERPVAVKAWKDGWAYAVANGFHKQGVGGKMADGVAIALKFVNEAFPAWNLKAYRFDMPRFDVDTPSQIGLYAALNYGWMATFGGLTSLEYVGDVLDDGIVQSDDAPTGSGVYGHLRNLFSHAPMTYTVDDNYADRQGKLVPGVGLPWRNRYLLPDLEKKVQNGQIFRSGYVFIA